LLLSFSWIIKMTKFNLNNKQLLKLYQVKNIESQDEFLQLLEDTLVDSSKRICTSRKKNTLAKNFAKLCESAKKGFNDPESLKKHIKLLEKILEDDITCRIVEHLDLQGFRASHESDHNGHVDILVQSDDKVYTWLGEAKLYKGSKYSEKGLYQLVSDYSTGAENESGGVLLYLNETRLRVKEIMSEWRSHLTSLSVDENNRLENLTFEPKKGTSAIFYTSHAHHRSGDPYRIRHCCLDIRAEF